MYKAILIEDDIPVLRQLNRVLSEMESDFDIVMAFTHPQDAIEYINENPVDAVITDIQLPAMTGIELCKYCQTHFPQIKFAILSAYDNFEYAQKAIDLEVVHYVLKPVTKSKLEVMLKKLSDKLKASENFFDRVTSEDLAKSEVESDNPQNRESFFEEQVTKTMSYIYENDFDSAIRFIEALRLIFDTNELKLIYTEILSSLSQFTQKTLTKKDITSETMFNIIVSDINTIKRRSSSGNSKPDIIEIACKFINDNFANDITLNDVAKHVFLSPIYFSSYFKKKTGKKYSDYLQNVKLQKACELLRDTDVIIPTIAEMSGFRDTNYFHKIFKNQFGITPSEYRKKYGRVV